jgi:hypothetical protein
MLSMRIGNNDIIVVTSTLQLAKTRMYDNGYVHIDSRLEDLRTPIGDLPGATPNYTTF